MSDEEQVSGADVPEVQEVTPVSALAVFAENARCGEAKSEAMANEARTREAFISQMQKLLESEVARLLGDEGGDVTVYFESRRGMKIFNFVVEGDAAAVLQRLESAISGDHSNWVRRDGAEGWVSYTLYSGDIKRWLASSEGGEVQGDAAGSDILEPGEGGPISDAEIREAADAIDVAMGGGEEEEDSPERALLEVLLDSERCGSNAERWEERKAGYERAFLGGLQEVFEADLSGWLHESSEFSVEVRVLDYEDGDSIAIAVTAESVVVERLRADCPERYPAWEMLIEAGGRGVELIASLDDVKQWLGARVPRRS